MAKNNMEEKEREKKKKHSALNPSLRRKTLSSRYAEVSLFKSLTPSVLPWKKGTQIKDTAI